MELKAAANILKFPIYIYTPTLKADGQYAWNKIVPDSHYIEIANVPSSDNNHIELCHTKGVHYDLIVLRNGTYPKDFPNVPYYVHVASTDRSMCMIDLCV